MVIGLERAHERGMTTTRRRTWILGVMLTVVGLAVIAQIVPYGRKHGNPPVVAEPRWDTAQTRALAERACFDCHSNQTKWPWYSHVAPVSWLVQHHVDEGREVLNFSDWSRRYKEAGEAAETVREREMPPRSYLLAHPEARLTDAEREQLARGFEATIAETRQSRADD
jgi:hypothetical protein